MISDDIFVIIALPNGALFDILCNTSKSVWVYFICENQHNQRNQRAYQLINLPHRLKWFQMIRSE